MILTLYVLTLGGMLSFILLSAFCYDLSERKKALRRRVIVLEGRISQIERARELYHIEATRYLCEIRDRLEALEKEKDLA